MKISSKLRSLPTTELIAIRNYLDRPVPAMDQLIAFHDTDYQKGMEIKDNRLAVIDTILEQRIEELFIS